jgi:hypothetical protein
VVLCYSMSEEERVPITIVTMIRRLHTVLRIYTTTHIALRSVTKSICINSSVGRNVPIVGQIHFSPSPSLVLLVLRQRSWSISIKPCQRGRPGQSLGALKIRAAASADRDYEACAGGSSVLRSSTGWVLHSRGSRVESCSIRRLMAAHSIRRRLVLGCVARGLVGSHLHPVPILCSFAYIMGPVHVSLGEKHPGSPREPQLYTRSSTRTAPKNNRGLL